MITYLFQIFPEPLLNWQKINKNNNNGNNNNHSNSSNKIWTHIDKENRRKIAGRDGYILEITPVDTKVRKLRTKCLQHRLLMQFSRQKVLSEEVPQKIDGWRNQNLPHIFLTFYFQVTNPLMSDSWKLLSWKTTPVLEEVVSKTLGQVE